MGKMVDFKILNNVSKEGNIMFFFYLGRIILGKVGIEFSIIRNIEFVVFFKVVWGYFEYFKLIIVFLFYK